MNYLINSYSFTVLIFIKLQMDCVFIFEHYPGGDQLEMEAFQGDYRVDYYSLAFQFSSSSISN
jgi:hypothetical protein